MKISAVIPVWNGRDYLQRLLRTIEKQTVAIDEIVVVDNGSADGVGQLALDWGAKVFRFALNQGFAAAVNRGVNESKGECIAILNSDVELSASWIELLMAAISDHSAWFASGLILSARNPERIDGTWDLVSKAGMPWRAGSGAPAAHPLFQQAREIQLGSFTAILLRRDLWKRVGPLDERLETYLEDVDFGLRCAKDGLTGYYEPRAVCRHQGSATWGQWSKRSVRLMSRNQVFLARKHFGSELCRRWGWNLLVGQVLWGLVAARHGAAFAWLQGKWDARGAVSLSRNKDSSLARLIESQEKEIFALQAELGRDKYWSWYGYLTGRVRPNDTLPRR